MKSISFVCDPWLLALTRRAVDGQKLPYPVQFGRVITGGLYYRPQDAARYRLNSLRFWWGSVDMEAAVIAYVCYVNQIPFIAIRTVTDTPVNSGIENFKNIAKRH